MGKRFLNLRANPFYMPASPSGAIGVILQSEKVNE